MANHLVDLEVGYAHAPSLTRTVSNFELFGTDPTPGNVMLTGLVVLVAYSIVWTLLINR
jgi:hypothetical protein